jgi:hypothetical protein
MGVSSQGALRAAFSVIPLPGSEGPCLPWATLVLEKLQTPRDCSVVGWVVCTMERVTEPGCAYHPAVSSN